MIFKHLFRAKHQNPDPNVRIQAIANFDREDASQKSILHELAFNDADANVSLAALNKLDSFALWYKMSEIAKNDRIQKRSQRVIEEVLLNANNPSLAEKDRRKFVLECKDNKLLEKLVVLDWVQADSELSLALLEKIDKPLLREKVMLSSEHQHLVLAMLGSVTDDNHGRKLLTKLVKKSKFAEVVTACEHKLQQWQDAELRPAQIESEVKMVLSRLLALKDCADYQVLQTTRTELEQAYQGLVPEFVLLAEQSAQSFAHKYSDILDKLQRSAEQLKPQYEQQQATARVQQQTDSLEQRGQSLQRAIAGGLSASIEDLSGQQVEKWQTELVQLIEDICAATHSIGAEYQAQHQCLEARLQGLRQDLSVLQDLPKVYVAFEKAQQLTAQLRDLPLPTEFSQVDAANEFMQELTGQWQGQVMPFQQFVPANAVKQWNKAKGEWQGAIKQIRQQVNQDVARCKAKIRIIDSLISQGKFKSAIGLYQKVQSWFSALPEPQQAKLANAYGDIQKQVGNLQDWQEYIAAPRKPALLAEAEALISQPLAVDQQAAAIKNLRGQWNSLGKLDTESDQALNQAFDTALENAFAPCREAYQQEQQQRAQNLKDKQAIIDALQAKDTQQCADDKLAKTLRGLQQRWKQIGDVDYKLKASLNSQYHELLTPLKQRMNHWYQDNQQAKQELVHKARVLAEQEDVDGAIESVKGLQQQWKDIGHAGRKAERELWDEFRLANDSLFAKRKAANQAYKSELSQKVSEVKPLLEQMAKQVEHAQTTADIQQSIAAKAEIEQQLADLPVAQRKPLMQQLHNILDAQQAKLAAAQSKAQSAKYQQLFSYLRSGDAQPQPNAQLPKAWLQWLATAQNAPKLSTSSDERLALTIKMEIVANQPSATADAGLRSQLQLEMMADKLGAGQQLDVSQLLQQWVEHGALQQQDEALLQRVEALFLNNEAGA